MKKKQKIKACCYSSGMLNKFLTAQFGGVENPLTPEGGISATRCDLLCWCFMLISTKNLLAPHSEQQLGRS